MNIYLFIFAFLASLSLKTRLKIFPTALFGKERIISHLTIKKKKIEKKCLLA